MSVYLSFQMEEATTNIAQHVVPGQLLEKDTNAYIAQITIYVKDVIIKVFIQNILIT